MARLNATALLRAGAGARPAGGTLIIRKPAWDANKRKYFCSAEKEIQLNCMNKAGVNRELFRLETVMDLLLFSFYIKSRS